ncbi:MAG: hypothetical protein K8S20_08950 [Chloroflexi bacterium]|nr:hypothetical protein [Chloroflexota bacterium]
MKSQYRMLLGVFALLFAVGCLCSNTNISPSTPSTNAPIATSSAPTANAPQPSTNGSSSGLVTFVDQNNLLSFDLPGDWTYEHNELGDKVYSDANAYSDTFTSPDEIAKMESLVIFANETVNNSVSAGAALDLLHRYYSATGKVGDIRISSDQIMQDGSERFEWTSKSGGYSGVSYFELRGNNKKTWLMLTAWWDDDSDQATLDVINNAIASYAIPQ